MSTTSLLKDQSEFNNNKSAKIKSFFQVFLSINYLNLNVLKYFYYDWAKWVS